MEITCRVTTWLPSNHLGLRCNNHPAEDLEVDLEVDREVDLEVDLEDPVHHHPTMTT